MSSEIKVSVIGAKEEDNGNSIHSDSKQYVKIIKFIVVTLCILSFVIFTTTFFNESACNKSKEDDTLEPKVNIVSRAEWGAQPPKDPPDRLSEIPAPYVIISHTATDFCLTRSQCTMHARFAQKFHVESFGWNDIAYNFLVGGDGNAYEGRGWDIEGAHTFNFNKMSIGISFIGTFNLVDPSKAQLHAAQKLIEMGIKAGHISKDYKLLGHRQLAKTESPGQKLYEIIQTWEHWSPTA